MTMTMEDVGLARAATQDEVAQYWANGWVKMERFIPPEVAAQMLKIAKVEILEKNIDDARSHERPVWRDAYNLGRDDGVQPFHDLVRSPIVGRNAQRFMHRDVEVALHADMLAVKMPSGHGSSGMTGYHQDYPNFPLDRQGLLTFWVALEDMTPEQGTMRFYSGSQKEGPLGKFDLTSDERGMLDHYKYVEDQYPLSPPLSLKAGDCTVHNALVIHGAPANTTERPRWTYLMSYFPGDACWTGVPHHLFGAQAGLTPGQPIHSPMFPVVARAS